MNECIADRYFGGKWFLRLLCFGCHIWKNEKTYTFGKITIERNKCVECGRTEIMVLVDWI